MKLRSDGWQNVLTGIGIANRDKRLGTTFSSDVLSQTDLEEMWEGDDMAARIIETLPDEMLRQGFEVKIQSQENSVVQGETYDAFQGSQTPSTSLMSSPPPKPSPKPIERKGEDARLQAEALQGKFEDLGLEDKLWDALCHERAFGGAGILVGADDGSTDLRKPLNLDAIKTIRFLTVLSAFELQPVTYYGDPLSPKYGEVEVYRIQTNTYYASEKSVSLQSYEVHESRFLIFGGIRTSRRKRQENIAQGWGSSVLVRCNRILSDFHMSWSSAAILLSDFAQAIIKIKDLAELIATDRDDVVIKRAQLIDLMRSTARAVLIDSDEDFERKATPMTGLPEMLIQMCKRLAAAADMPVMLLMGDDPSGLNATGDNSVRFFYDRVKARVNKRLKPQIERLVKLCLLSKDGPTKGIEPENWSVCFKPLWQATDLEQSTIRKTQADTDKIYIDSGVVTPEEIAQSRFGGDSYATDTQLDFEGREEMASEDSETEAP